MLYATAVAQVQHTSNTFATKSFVGTIARGSHLQKGSTQATQSLAQAGQAANAIKLASCSTVLCSAH